MIQTECLTCRNLHVQSKTKRANNETKWHRPRSTIFIISFGRYLHTNLACVFFVDFEQANVCWV